MAPSFIPSRAFVDFLRLSFGETVLAELVKKMNDIMNAINEQRTGLQSLGTQVKSAMEAFFRIFGDEHRERPLVGVGYSGGFIPVVDAIENGNYDYDVNAYVALGGASIAIGAEIAKLLVDVIQGFENVATARTPEAREAYKQAFDALAKGFSLMGPTGALASTFASAAEQFIGVLGEAYNLLGQGSINAAAQAFYGSLEIFVQTLSGFGWGMPGTVDAKMMVNIYGTEDLLATKTSIAGYRTEWAGFSSNSAEKPLFNIVIEGADHFDYIQGVDPSKTGDDLTRNEIISHFVAQLIVKSESPEVLKDFLDNPPIGVTLELIGERYYRVNFRF